MERDVNNVPCKQQNEKGPQPGTSSSSSSSSSANERYFSKHSQNASDNRQHSSDHNREQSNRERKTSVPTTTCGNMESNILRDSRNSCEACGVQGTITQYCGLSMCNVCVAFVTHMVKKKFTVRCKHDGKCKTTPNSDGKVRCKSCKLQHMIKLPINHPDWINYKLTGSRRRPADSSNPVSSATSRTTSSVTSQPIFNDLLPTRISSEYKTPQAGTSTSNTTSVKVKGASKSEAKTSEKIESTQGDNRVLICRACKRVRDNDDSTLCLDCVNFVVDVKSISTKYKCNKQGDTSQRDHLFSCISCRLDRITNATAQMPTQNDQKGPQPVEERRRSSSSHQTSNHHDQTPKRQAQSNPTNVTPQNSSNLGSHHQPLCQGCDNPNHVGKRFNLNLCVNCYEFIRANSLCPQRFDRRCLHGGNCSTRYAPNTKMCMPCRTRRLRKLDIQEPAWIRYRKKLGLIKRSGQPAVSTATGTSTSAINPSRIGQNKQQGKFRPQHTLGVRKCPACGNPKVRKALFGGAVLCNNCVSYIKYTLDTVSEPVICKHLGKCSTHYSIGRSRCRSCRIKKLFAFRIKKGAWKRFKKMYLSKLESSKSTHTEKINDPEQPCFDRPPSQTANASPTRPQQQSVADPPQTQPSYIAAQATQASEDNGQANATTASDEIISVVDNEPTDCVACRGPNYLPATRYGLNLCISCVKFIERMPVLNFNVKCRKQGNCRTTFLLDHRIKCNLCRLKALLKLDIRHPAWIEYKEGTQGDCTISTNEQASDTIDQSYGVVCGICGNERTVSRRSEEFICCSNCWQFLLYAEVRNFRDVCKTGKYDCKLEHAGQGRMCQGCRIRRAMNIGFWDPKLKNSPHKDLLSSSDSSEDSSSASSSEQALEENVEQPSYSWCNDCATQFQHPTNRSMNISTEQDSGVCQSPNLLEIFPPPADRVCPTCQAKRAASLGLRVRSPQKARDSHELTRANEIFDECPRVSRTSPTKDHNHSTANRSPQPCVICEHTERVSIYPFGIFCCQNCKFFLQKAVLRPKFPPDCVTGRHDCKLRHIRASEWNQKNRMCSGCRAREAIRLGFKRPDPSEPAPEEDEEGEDPPNLLEPPPIQLVYSGVERRELATSVSVISSAHGGHTGGFEREQKLVCALCNRNEIVLKKEAGCIQSCLDCELLLQTCENKPLYLSQCKTVAPNCENRESQTQNKKFCYRCLARKAASLGHNWTRPLDIAEMLADPSKLEQCDLCPQKRKARKSGLGFNWCNKCRYFLIKTAGRLPHDKYRCQKDRFNCLKEGFWKCSGCRLKQAIDLGYENKNTKAWLQANNLHDSPDVDECSTPSPVVVCTDSATSAHQDSLISHVPSSPVGSLFVEDDDDDDGHTQLAIDTQPSPSTDDDDTIDVEYLEDHQNATLHPSETLDRVLCRWFSCEQELPSPSPEPTKTIEDEVLPTPEVQVIVFSNDIGAGHNLPLVTQDLNPTERQSVDELTVTKLYMKPSSSLLRTLSPDGSDALAASATTQPQRTPKLKMTLTLKILRTTVDRRPMLKKQKTPTGVHLRPHTPSTQQPTTRRSSTPPLIAPGEDCDASDDDNDELPDYIIDCNN